MVTKKRFDSTSDTAIDTKSVLEKMKKYGDKAGLNGEVNIFDGEIAHSLLHHISRINKQGDPFQITPSITCAFHSTTSQTPCPDPHPSPEISHYGAEGLPS